MIFSKNFTRNLSYQRSYQRRLQRISVLSRRDIVMANTEADIIAITQRLLNSISIGDYDTYKTLCAPDLTCFEPESAGHQVEGLDFHKYYFDHIDYSAAALARSQGQPLNLNTIVAPKVRILGSDAAVISYVRLTQKGGPNPVTAKAEETRIWEKRSGSWVLVHFHKSVS
ncbi:hypothetical protein CEUSTIGMA_g7391.t1 [Chlamydomonas eustigma]|uniref:Calcium/calmodulin-dependent protein kinase II association-domain domain-containing protein n=1 Tax=Chlamydomonas eustigma TaxID=1157962 RepID=A0A250XAR0_9CHLO|nr:hypothetical protein CEUSTIGMA_g7391.t1 [Chlamydomonas eustigma]|eukprot:GAX79952.1 hypothetical protein CEUSTIGMA_g7391.t1 [Chlamydomonas eustigma]